MDWGDRVDGKKLGIIGAATLIGLAAVWGLISAGAAWFGGHSKTSVLWNVGTIRATYVGAQLREVNPSNAILVLHYNLENGTDDDYQLSDMNGIVIMCKLKSDGTLTSEDHIKLSYPTFLPARQRARVALEIPHPFDWPAENDPLMRRKLQDFIADRLADVDEFVLFDQSSRRQIEFPRGWEESQLVSTNPR